MRTKVVNKSCNSCSIKAANMNAPFSSCGESIRTSYTLLTHYGTPLRTLDTASITHHTVIPTPPTYLFMRTKLELIEVGTKLSLV